MKHRHHPRATAVATLAALAAGALLSACGSSASGGGADVTVTVTPTVTVQPSGGGKPAPPKGLKSDVVGRGFDFGVVTKVSTIAGTTVIELDRWTWTAIPDDKVAKSGVPTGAFTGGVPYTNQNAKLTYTIPIADGARILYNHCLAPDQPVQTKSIAPTALKGLADRENTVLVQLDTAGRATSIQNVPGCPA